jgi:MEDS: MEthanogen/methylotroph, DcmR Sensory domain
MTTTAQSSQFTESFSIPRGHICAFFNSIDEERRVLQRFIKDGFDQRDKAYHLVDPAQREEHLRWLTEAGINVRKAMSTGQLEVRPWQDGPLSNISLDPDTWMAAWEQALQLGPAAGYAHTRFVAHMEWALGQRWEDVDLFEFETRLNYVIPKYEDWVICSYNLVEFGASVVMDALRTHPVVIIGGLFHENPFFVSPDQLLLEIRERRERRPAGNRAGAKAE